MINLHELLKIKESDFSKYKVHFATGSDNKKDPYNAFLIDEFKQWQEHQSKHNFGREFVISLIYYDRDIWMFGGVYRILSFKHCNSEDCWRYETQLTDCATEYIGRAFFKFKKEFRASYPTLELEPKNGIPIAKMVLSHILEKRITLSDFVGFSHVNIEYKTLKHIVADNILSWKTALSNVKGVYLIVDKKTGRQYVGSAYGDECIWQRWEGYAKDGHGGNADLIKLLRINGEEYRNNFKYSILEVCNMNFGNEYIIERESYWKEVLLTREFGLNNN